MGSVSELPDGILPGSSLPQGAVPGSLIGRPWDVESVKSNSVELINDLQAAVEVNSLEGPKVLYPNKSLNIGGIPMGITVSLRDAPHIQGICKGCSGTQLFTSFDFGDFGTQAQNFLADEEVAVEREQRLQTGRTVWLQNKAMWAMWRLFRLNLCIWSLLLVLLVVCIIVPTESYAIALLLGFGGGCLCCCTSNFSLLWTLYSVINVSGLSRLDHVKAEDRVERCAESLYSFLGCSCVLVSVSLLVMTVMYYIRGFPWAAALLWVPVLLGSACILAALTSTNIEDMYHTVIERIFGNMDEVEKEAQFDLSRRTIVFEGNILPGEPCVSSWPGRYESAWDALVHASLRGHLSAAVVFLPQGSRDFGIHDKIPEVEELEGDCWCTPLYGEKKPWGCKWWTHWIANIEEAVGKGAKLQVYFFHRMKGKGKVESFATAGQEHLRREEIFRKKGQFKESHEFQTAINEGLKKLPTKQGGDSTSQYSREEHRLFLAWLDEEDREFLVSSEGLGNSQKAEVAWLERKGYAYEEVEVDISRRSGWKVTENTED